jgi:serine/threonine protein kinase
MSGTPLLFEIAQELANESGLKEIKYEGKGAFKETYRATTTSGDIVALKIFNPDKCCQVRTAREIDTLKKCNSQLIAKLYDYGEFNTLDNKYSFMIEEFLDGGALTSQIKNNSLTPDIVKQYAISLIEALDYLRRIDLVHRDIKPDNIMFKTSSDKPVLVDFGIARDLSKSSLTPSYLPQGPGTPYYSAPEQLNNDKPLIQWRTDQFSLGIVLGICLTGYHPFEESGMNEVETVNRIALREPCTDRFCKDIIDSGFECIIKMIEPWPVRRYRLPNDLLASFIKKEK